MPPPSSPTSLTDGIATVRRGMNSGMEPRLLPTDQVAMAVNLTFRNGLARTRPALRKVALNYANDDTRTNATEALFQGAAYHQAFGGGENSIIASIGGRIFRYLVGTTRAVSDVSVAADLNDPTAPQAWMWQSEDFLVIQNGLARPLFWDGASLRRALPDVELPPGCMGAYVQGRNWVTLPDRRSFVAGDLVYSQGVSGPYGGRDAVLKFTENNFLSGGGAFAVPLNAGLINAMTNIAISDTSLGQGPLQVLTQYSVYSVQVPFDRTAWADTSYPLMVVGLPGYGALSQHSTVSVNGDLWYRSLDGIRNYIVARRDFGSFVNTPLSIEMERVLSADTLGLLPFGSAVVFDNRLLMTCSPYNVQGRGIAHRGLVALDLQGISGITAHSAPAYDGLWTGLPILRILKGIFAGVERCFVFALDEDDAICLYELVAGDAARFDNNGDEDVGTACFFESRALLQGNVAKKLQNADLFLDKLLGPDDGTVSFTLSYKPDQYPLWQEWHSWSKCAPATQCDRSACDPLLNIWPQYAAFTRLPMPSDSVCNAVTKRPMPMGYEFQVRLEWEGYAQLNRLLLYAQPTPEMPASACPTSESCVLLSGCDDMNTLFNYSIEG